MIKIILLLTVVIAVQGRPAYGQTPSEAFQAGAHVTMARSGQFDSTELGIGGRVSWHPVAMLGIESEVGFYPADLPGGSISFSASRLEGLFGVTAGPRLQRLRPFARVRAGFLRYSGPTEGFPCVAIFPPPLNCLMASAGTRPIFDLGGGLELFTTGRTFLRIDAGDRMVSLPAPTLTDGFVLRENEFFSHDFRLSVGGGFRF